MLPQDSHTFLQIFWESPTYHLDHPVPQESYEIYCPSKLLNHGSSGDSAITMQFADVLHNMSLTVLVPWQQTAFQTFPIF